MKKGLLFICFLFIAILSNAQTPSFEWAKSLSGSSDEYGHFVAVDSFGNVYTTGKFIGVTDFDPGPGIFNLSTSGGYDMFISKIDSTGNFIWAKKIGGTSFEIGYTIAIDKLGNIHLTGTFMGTVDFNPGAGVFNLTSYSATLEDVFVLKLDSSGNFIWVKQIGGTTYEIAGSVIDTAGNVYTTGIFDGTIDCDPGTGTFNLGSFGGYDTFISKLDSAGNFVWAKKFGSTWTDTGVSTIDKYGNIYITGSFMGTVDFNPGPGSYNMTCASGSSWADAYISKLDASGNFLWAKRIGGVSGDGANSISIDKFGNILTTGSFQGVVDFDPNIGVYNLTSSSSGSAGSIFVLKLNSIGNFVWAKGIDGGSYITGSYVAVDSFGNVYTSGSFGGTSDFDPSLGVFNLTSPLGSDDVFISKLDTSGTFIWAFNFGGTISADRVSSLSVDIFNNVYTTGIFAGTADFDPNPGIFNITSSGGGDVFILKLAGTNCVWPGDADNNYVADNNDLLPIGVFYGQTGTPRTTTSNTWQAYSSAEWGTLQSNGADIKHADCNGDGTIDNNDTLAVNLNFALTHAFAPVNNDVRLPAADLHFITSSSSYLSGSIVDVEVWAGDATTPVTNLYGLAFDINYDASLVQPATESLTYPSSWLGTPGTNAITIAKIDALANTAYGAETKINQINSSGFGKIADFKFQLKSSIPANTEMVFSISGYQANDATGASILFNVQPDTIIINSTASITEINNETQISIYPNPTNGSFNIFTSQQIKNGRIEIYNTIGELVFSQKIINQQNTIDLKNQASGLYFVKVISDGEVIGMKKVVKE